MVGSEEFSFLPNKAPGVTDTGEYQLWQSFREGNQRAFAEIYERYARKLLSYGRKMTADAQVIEDAIQDLFIELWKGRANLSPTHSIQFYLFRALRNKLSRHRPGIALPDPESDEWLNHEDLFTIPFETALIAEEQENEQANALRQAIGKLSQRQQEIIHLRYYQHMDNRQITELMGINDQSVRNLLHTALLALRQVLAGGILLLFIRLLFTSS